MTRVCTSNFQASAWSAKKQKPLWNIVNRWKEKQLQQLLRENRARGETGEKPDNKSLEFISYVSRKKYARKYLRFANVFGFMWRSMN